MRWCVRVRVCTLVLMRWCRYAGTTNAPRCLLLDGHFKARLHLHAPEPDCCCSYSQLTQRSFSTATVVKCQTILRSANISDSTLSSSSQCIASMLLIMIIAWKGFQRTKSVWFVRKYARSQIKGNYFIFSSRIY